MYQYCNFCCKTIKSVSIHEFQSPNQFQSTKKQQLLHHFSTAVNSPPFTAELSKPNSPHMTMIHSQLMWIDVWTTQTITMEYIHANAIRRKQKYQNAIANTKKSERETRVQRTVCTALNQMNHELCSIEWRRERIVNIKFGHNFECCVLHLPFSCRHFHCCSICDKNSASVCLCFRVYSYVNGTIESDE